MNIFWLLRDGGPFFWEMVGSAGYILTGGGWWWMYFGWWWVVVDIFWLLVGGGGYILDGGKWLWMVVGCGWWWVVVGCDGSWHSLVWPLTKSNWNNSIYPRTLILMQEVSDGFFSLRSEWKIILLPLNFISWHQTKIFCWKLNFTYRLVFKYCKYFDQKF